MVWLHCAVPGNKPTNDQYCNARFGYCIDYPAGTLIPQHEAANGDGRKFIARNGEVVLTVFGRLNQDEEGNAIPFEKQYSIDLASLQKKAAITYKKLTGTYYVISGRYKTGKIFYHKVILKEYAFCFALLEYSKDRKEEFDPYASIVFKTFK